MHTAYSEHKPVEPVVLNCTVNTVNYAVKRLRYYVFECTNCLQLELT